MEHDDTSLRAQVARPRSRLDAIVFGVIATTAVVMAILAVREPARAPAPLVAAPVAPKPPPPKPLAAPAETPDAPAAEPAQTAAAATPPAPSKKAFIRAVARPARRAQEVEPKEKAADAKAADVKDKAGAKDSKPELPKEKPAEKAKEKPAPKDEPLPTFTIPGEG